MDGELVSGLVSPIRWEDTGRISKSGLQRPGELWNSRVIPALYPRIPCEHEHGRRGKSRRRCWSRVIRFRAWANSGIS